MSSVERKQIATVILSIIGMVCLLVAVFLTAQNADPRCCLAVASGGGGALLVGTAMNSVITRQIKNNGRR